MANLLLVTVFGLGISITNCGYIDRRGRTILELNQQRIAFNFEFGHDHVRWSPVVVAKSNGSMVFKH